MKLCMNPRLPVYNLYVMHGLFFVAKRKIRFMGKQIEKGNNHYELELFVCV